MLKQLFCLLTGFIAFQGLGQQIAILNSPDKQIQVKTSKTQEGLLAYQVHMKGKG